MSDCWICSLRKTNYVFFTSCYSIVSAYKGPLNYTMSGGEGETHVLVQAVPNLEVSDNPYIDKLLPLNDDIDKLARNLDDFKVTQDSSIFG